MLILRSLTIFGEHKGRVVGCNDDRLLVICGLKSFTDVPMRRLLSSRPSLADRYPSNILENLKFVDDPTPP